MLSLDLSAERPNEQYDPDFDSLQRDLLPPWNQHFQDLLHGRFETCTKRILGASEEDVQKLKCSLLAPTLLKSHGGKLSLKQQRASIDYAKAVRTRGIEPNDLCSWRAAGIGLMNSVVVAAAHGANELLEFLLVESSECSLAVSTGPFTEGHALFEAVNSCHGTSSMQLLFEHRHDELTSLLKEESQKVGWNTLERAIMRENAEAVSILHEEGNARLCYLLDTEQPKLEKVLQEMYPGTNVHAWSTTLHWSFPHKDRQMINWLWHRLVPASVLPSEVWLHVMGFLGRETLRSANAKKKDKLTPGAPWFSSAWA